MKFIIFFLVFFTQVCYAIDVPTVNFMEIISISKILWTILLLLISYVFITLFTKIIEFFAEKSSLLRISIKGVVPIIRIGFWIAIITIIIKVIYNPPIEMLMTALASVAIAIGFATQDLLKNIFGGIMLLFDRPFKVGDKIKVGEDYGEVITIDLQTTRIVTPDDSMVVIPNMKLMNSRISNSNSGELYCQVVAKIALPIDFDMQKVRKTAIEGAQVSKYIYLNKPITVLFTNEINEHKSFIEMKLKAYVMDIRYEFLFKSDMTEVVIKELLNQGLLNNNNKIGDTLLIE